MNLIWEKPATRSDAQQITKGAKMRFLRFTRANTGKDQKDWFRKNPFSHLIWNPTPSVNWNDLESANINLTVFIAGSNLGLRNMTLDHSAKRSTNNSAPGTHLQYDAQTIADLEKLNLTGSKIRLFEHNGAFELHFD